MASTIFGIIFCVGLVVLIVFFVISKWNDKQNFKRIEKSKTGNAKWFHELKVDGIISTDPKTMEENGVRIILEEGSGDKHAFVIIKDEEIGKITYDIGTKQQKASSPLLEPFQIKDTHYMYHPSEYVYTGATVGGVTMGSVKEVGNYYSQHQTGNGKYAISCRHIITVKEYEKFKNKDKFLVFGMYISSSLIDSAKNIKVLAQFQDKEKENYFVFFHNPPKSNIDADTFNKSSFSMKQELINMNTKQYYLSKDECWQIITWINNKSDM